MTACCCNKIWFGSSSSCCSSGFTPGQWVLLGVPSLAGSSLWDVHPFSVTSSCTADPESFTVHVKASGSGPPAPTS